MQFDNFANCYTQNAFIQKDLIDWGLPYFDVINLDNQSILELGAGTGLLTQQLVKQNISHILATDKSPSMIIQGKECLNKANWQLLDAWNAIPEGFDHIFSSSLLQWSPNPEETIAQWSKKLSPGGSIHALFFIDQTLIELRQLLSLEKTIKWRTFEYWIDIFKNVGLSLQLHRNLIKRYEFPNALALLRNLKYTGTTFKNSICCNSLKKIIKEYDKKFPSPNGVYSTWQFCQIVGTQV